MTITNHRNTRPIPPVRSMIDNAIRDAFRKEYGFCPYRDGGDPLLKFLHKRRVVSKSKTCNPNAGGIS